jgi:hypothetical protein
MSRQDQFAGLPDDAVLFLNENVKEPTLCPHCNYMRPFKTEVIGTYTGMFGTEYQLVRHHLKDGGWADDCLQADPWSGGPVFFLALLVYGHDGELLCKFCWSDEEINKV